MGFGLLRERLRLRIQMLLFVAQRLIAPLEIGLSFFESCDLTIEVGFPLLKPPLDASDLLSPSLLIPLPIHAGTHDFFFSCKDGLRLGRRGVAPSIRDQQPGLLLRRPSGLLGQMPLHSAAEKVKSRPGQNYSPECGSQYSHVW